MFKARRKAPLPVQIATLALFAVLQFGIVGPLYAHLLDSKKVDLPGETTVALAAGDYDVSFYRRQQGCRPATPANFLPTDFAVTSVASGEPLALQLLTPAGYCNHGTWEATIARFTVVEGGEYRISADLNAGREAEARLRVQRRPILPILADRFVGFALPFMLSGLVAQLAVQVALRWWRKRAPAAAEIKALA